MVWYSELTLSWYFKKECSVGNALQDAGIGNFSLSRSPGVQGKGPTSKKWDLRKLQSFCAAKETISQLKRQRMGENVCQACIRWRVKIQNIQIAKRKLTKMVKELSREFLKKISTSV